MMPFYRARIKSKTHATPSEAKARVAPRPLAGNP